MLCCVAFFGPIVPTPYSIVGLEALADKQESEKKYKEALDHPDVKDGCSESTWGCRICVKCSQPIGNHPLSDTLFLHIARN